MDMWSRLLEDIYQLCYPPVALRSITKRYVSLWGLGTRDTCRKQYAHPALTTAGGCPLQGE